MPFPFHKSLCALLILWLPVSHAEEITLAVAANFSRAAKQLAKEFEQHSEHRVQMSFGSTGAHYAQIMHGAPFDAFFAADDHAPLRLEQAGRIKRGSRFTYARGQLVLWSARADLVDNEGKVLQRGDFAHIALANPRLAPYGQAAQQTLDALGVAAQLQEKIVRGENISQTYQFIYTGAAELGFVALAQLIDPNKASAVTAANVAGSASESSESESDSRAADSHWAAGSHWIVPPQLYKPIEQQAVLLSEKKAAQEFMDFVRSERGRNIIRAHGYE